MTPAAHELPYYQASRAAHRAWLSSQPQFVIPGVLEQVDAGTTAGVPAGGVGLLEPAVSVSPPAAGSTPNERRTP
jgi:hypothetical protein